MSSRRPIALATVAAAVAACFASTVHALPTNPAVIHGTASFAQSGNSLTVTNSNGAIINWGTFSIQTGETTHFQQTSRSSSVLNQVTGVMVNGTLKTDPSVLLGHLTSNGRVWLINPAGILVGNGAVIDTAGFVGSTLLIRAEDFLAGRLTFQNTPGAGNMVNQGTIKTSSGGSVYLVGTNVSNEGIITTPKGEVILAAGETVSLVDTGTPGVKVEVTGAQGNATNLGEVAATAGRIGMAGVLVRNTGTLNASSVSSAGGRIFLSATRSAVIDGNGQVLATGTKGGQVEVLGDSVAMQDTAVIDVSGAREGGTVLVGGDYQGQNSAVRNATTTYFGPDAAIRADATRNGRGGKVIVWSDDTTRALGRISARGTGKGAGGFVETSGKKVLLTDGIRVDTSAANGKTGTWLLDPATLIIDGAWWAANAPNLITTNLLIQTDGVAEAAISFTGETFSSVGANTLTVNAKNGGIGLSSTTQIQLAGGMIMRADDTISDGGGGQISARFLDAKTTAGDITLAGNNDIRVVRLVTNSGDIYYKSAASMVTVTGAADAGNIYVGSTTGDIGLGLLTASGAIEVDSARKILDDNGTFNTNLQGSSVILASGGSTSPSFIAISADVASPSIDASVAGSATYGGIDIRQTDSTVSPASVSLALADNSLTAGHGNVRYYSVGDVVLDSNDSISSNSGGVTVFGRGDMLVDGASLSTADVLDVGAGRNMTVSSAGLAHDGGALRLGAGGSLVTIGDVGNDSGNLRMHAGGLLDIGGALYAPTGNVELHGNVVRIQGGMSGTGDAQNVTVDGNHVLVDGTLQATYNVNIKANSGLAVTGGVFADNNINIVTGGNIVLDGGSLVAANEVVADLNGGASEFQLNNGGMVDANSSGGPALIRLTFNNRASGGIKADGLDVVFDPGIPSGFVNNGYVATPNDGMVVTYRGAFDLMSLFGGGSGACHFRGSCIGAYNPVAYARLSDAESIAMAQEESIGNQPGQFGGDNGRPQRPVRQRPGQCR